ncbi:MAG: acyl-CoA thioesterase [Pseudobdellovibrionaceae bacterium]
MNQIFHTKKTLTFRDADPIGIMFFGNIYGIAHDAFEDFIIAAGYKYEEWFKQKKYLMPIRHSEADFLGPLMPGQTYDISVSVAHLGQTSFKIKYVFSQKNQRQEETIHAVVSTVHAVVDAENMQKSPLPELMRSRLQVFLEPTAKGIL